MDTYPFLHGLLDPLLLLVLAGPLPVELVREVAEGFLGAERAAVVVHVLQLDGGAEARLLAEFRRRPVRARLAPPVLVVLTDTHITYSVPLLHPMSLVF